MTLKEWQKVCGNQKIPGMNGIFDTRDMTGRVLCRDVYIKGQRVLRIAPILPDEEIVIEERLL
ncbi:MAG: hypothetical protein WCI27_05395 [Candidatus Omnitrophota bacterium]